MSTASRLGGYAATLTAVFCIAWAVGSVVGAPPSTGHAGHTTTHEGHEGPPVSSVADIPAGPVRTQAPTADTLGLASTRSGYTMAPENTSFTVGRAAELAFSVTGPGGGAVTGFDTVAGRQMDVVVIRRDAAGFQHLHPDLGADGVWRAPLTLPGGGVWRAYADFTPTGGPPLVLGTDLFVPGDFTPFRFAESRAFEVDGYQVRLDGVLTPGVPSPVFATVSRDGAPVTDLAPVLGAFGHLTALRQGDLAYQQIPPDSSSAQPADRAGPGIAFTADVPSAGAYRLFLEFEHGGAVHTAEFSVSTQDAATDGSR